MIKAYNQRFTGAILLIAAIFATFSCTKVDLPGYDIPDGYYTDAESIETNIEEWSMEVGDKKTITATVSPDDIYYPGVTWSSSDESVVTVSTSGVVTAVALGEANIIITSEQTESLTKQIPISVVEEVVDLEKIEIIRLSTNEVVESIDVPLNDFVELGVKFTPENATNTDVMWVITDYAEIASVERGNGTVWGKSEGVCHVEVKSLGYEDIAAQCTVNCTYIALESFTIFSTESFEADPDDPEGIVPEDEIHTGSRTIGVTQEILLEIDTEPYNASVKTIKWESNDPNIATIDEDGNVTGQGMGTATITATCTDYDGNQKQATFDVEVTEIIADSFSFYSKYSSVRPGEALEADIVLNTYPSYAIIPSDTQWALSGAATDVDYEVVTDEYGGVTVKVTAGSETGDFTLTATYYKEVDLEQVEVTASITLSVDDATNVNIDPEFHGAAFPLTDGSVQLTWSYYDTDTTGSGSGNGTYDNPTIDWTSDDESIATVDDDGKVTFLEYGDVTISAKSSYDDTIETVLIKIPGGYWREPFNENKSFGTANGIYYGSDYFLFSHGVATGNSSASHYEDGYITITNGYETDYASASSPKYPDEDNANIYYTASRRTDIWCYDETICPLNANTYPYVAFHIDDIIAQGLGNVKYIELDFNVTGGDTGGTSIAKISSIGSYDGYSDGNNPRVSVRYLSNDTQILIFDLLTVGNANLIGSLTSASTSYYTPYSISINYNQYGYDVDQYDSDSNLSAEAMTAFSFNMYNVQTFASEADIDAYIADLGLTEK